MNIWRKFAVILTTGFVLVACNDEEPDPEPTDPEEGPVETDPDDNGTDPEVDPDDTDTETDPDEDTDLGNDDTDTENPGSQVAPDQWAQNLSDAVNTLDSYHQSLAFDVEISEGGTISDTDTDWLDISVIGDKEEGYVATDENGVTHEMYFVGNDAYMSDGFGWTAHLGEGPVTITPEYYELVESLVEIEDFINFEEVAGNIVLTYEGYDREVWNAFEQEYSLSIEGVQEENITITLEATIDEATSYLQDLTFIVVGVEEQFDGRIEIMAESDFSDFDAVDLSDVRSRIESELDGDLGEDTGNGLDGL